MNIRKGDLVQVIAGDDAGLGAKKVLRVLRGEGKVVVEGVNKVYKHLKPSRMNPQGGRLSKEMPVDVSNVMLFCPACTKGVRVGKKVAADGTKTRVCKTCGHMLGKIGK